MKRTKTTLLSSNLSHQGTQGGTTLEHNRRRLELGSKKCNRVLRTLIFIFIGLGCTMVVWFKFLPQHLEDASLLNSFELALYEKFPGMDINIAALNWEPKAMVRRRILESEAHPYWALLSSRPNVNSLYYAKLQVGIPRQEYFLDVDTGSSLTWINCKFTKTAKSQKEGPNGLYDPKRSGSFIQDPDVCVMAGDKAHTQCSKNHPETVCQYHIEYLDEMSTRGVLVEDFVTLTLTNNNKLETKFIFGCGYDQQGMEYEIGPDQPTIIWTDGMLGLGRRASSLPIQLYSQGLLQRNIVGFCLLPPLKRKQLHVAGFLFFGKNKDISKGGPMTWTPMNTLSAATLSHEDDGQYEADLNYVKYGGEKIATYTHSQRGRIVGFDFGAAMSWFTTDLYVAILRKVQKQATLLGFAPIIKPNQPYGPTCWKPSYPKPESLRKYFESLSFGFKPGVKGASTVVPKEAIFEIPPTNYLTYQIEDNNDLGLCLMLRTEDEDDFHTFGGNPIIPKDS